MLHMYCESCGSISVHVWLRGSECKISKNVLKVERSVPNEHLQSLKPDEGFWQRAGARGTDEQTCAPAEVPCLYRRFLALAETSAVLKSRGDASGFQ